METPEPQKLYLAFYKERTLEVWASSSYAAQQEAAKLFNVKRTWDVAVVLAEKDGKPVTHLPLF